MKIVCVAIIAIVIIGAIMFIVSESIKEHITRVFSDRTFYVLKRLDTLYECLCIQKKKDDDNTDTVAETKQATNDIEVFDVLEEAISKEKKKSKKKK